MKTFNKRGDRGETSLLYGGRVAKSHGRTEAYGTIDEAVSALGLARSLSSNERVCSLILQFQKELFTVGAEMATDPEHYDKLVRNFGVISMEQVDRIEQLIAEFEAEIAMPDSFVIPGGTPAAAALDLARTIVRRSERRAVGLRSEGLIQNDAILSYLNRLADLIFTLARYEEQQATAHSSGDVATVR
jgi:cob(I)alamin adenosyltransferase